MVRGRMVDTEAGSWWVLYTNGAIEPEASARVVHNPVRTNESTTIRLSPAKKCLFSRFSSGQKDAPIERAGSTGPTWRAE